MPLVYGRFFSEQVGTKVKNFTRMAKAIGSVSFQKDTVLMTVPNILITLLGSSINLSTPYLLLYGLNQLSSDNADMSEEDKLLYKNPLFLATLYGVAWTLGHVLPSIRSIMLSRLNQKMSSRLERSILEKYFRQPLAYTTGHDSCLEANFFWHSENTSINFMTGFWSDVLPPLVEMAAILALVSQLQNDYYINMTLAGATVIYLFAIILGSRWVAKTQAVYNDTGFSAFKTFVGRLRNYENAHIYNNIQYEFDELDSALKPFNSAKFRNTVSREVSSIFQIITIGVGFALILFFAAQHIKDHDSSSEALIALILYISLYSADLDQFAKVLNRMHDSYNYFNQISDYVAKRHIFSDDQTQPNLTINKDHADIEFQNVYLKYDEAENFTLNDVSFRVKTGQKAVIVGKTGAGKSSILRLLFGFYNPTQGKLLINDQDILSVNRLSIRKSIAFIPQFPVLFNKTIRENVKYGEDSATDHEANIAIRDAQLEETIKARGEQKTIGVDGSELSGGERKRISLARALLKIKKGASIVIADEPTSGLDTNTSHDVLSELHRFSKNITTIIITHQPDEVLDILNISNAIVLEEGKLVEQGDPKKLRFKNGFFSKYLNNVTENPNREVRGNTNSNVNSMKSESFETADSDLEPGETTSLLDRRSKN